MPYSSDAQKRVFGPAMAEKAGLNKKKVADAGQKIEVEQHEATLEKEDEAQRLLEQERDQL